ncbi:hypothetical protein AX15_001094 [Amanita polypyramis BW_CC]|nr:hypothetical protein AX15_001094 [Amanita polypyramis BW_CC]
MRPSLCIFVLSLIATSFATRFTAVAEEPTRRFNPGPTEVRARCTRSPWLELSQLEDSYLTNGMRLAKGYPPKPPHRRTVIHNLRSTQNATIEGYLEVIDSENRQTLGHISKEYNKFGEYGMLTNNSTEYLLVSLNMNMVWTGDGSWNAIISTINGPLAAYPFFGAITGFNSTSDDLKEGHYNYAVFGGTVSRLASSHPMQGGNSFAHLTGIHNSIETAIFSYNPSTSEIQCRWVNGDGSEPTTFIGLDSQEGW